MNWQAWLTLAVLCSVLIGAYKDHNRAWRYFAAGAVVLYLAGVNNLAATFTGVLNEGVLTLAVMLMISTSLFNAGLIDGLIRKFLPKKGGTPFNFSIRVLLPVSLLSGTLNNTPVVAMLIQPVRQWARQYGLDAHQFLLPLSYAAIIGGTLTLVGTSTNLVVLGLLNVNQVDHSLSLFSPAIIGGPLVIVGCLYFVFLIARLKKNTNTESLISTGRYLFRARQVANGFSGKTLVQANLRQLDQGYLYQVQRVNGDLLDASSETIIMPEDEFHFSGSPALANELSILGLELNELPDQKELKFYEVIVPANSALVGKTPQEVNFRGTYHASIVSVAHQDENIMGRIGEWRIQPGDMMVLCAAKNWAEDKTTNELQLLSVEELKHPKTMSLQLLALFGLFFAVVIGSFTSIGLLKATTLYLFLLLFARVTTPRMLKQALPTELLGVILGALALAEACINTGLAGAVVSVIEPVVGGPVSALIAIYLVTWILTELLTNNAAAAVMLPFALAIGSVSGLSVNQIALTVMIAASSSFITPFGYQTNLMVLAAGNYRPSDYLKYGLPLLILVSVVTITIVLNWVD